MIYCCGTGSQIYLALLRRGANVRLVSSPKRLAEVLKDGDAVIYYYWDPDAVETYRRITETMPNVILIPKLDSLCWFDRIEATLRMDEVSGFSHGVTRYYWRVGEPWPILDGTWVIKEGNHHQGEGKYLVRGDERIEVREPCVIEPYIEGRSIRVLVVGERVFVLEYLGESWIKNGVDHTEIRRLDMNEFPELVEDAKRIVSATNLTLAGIDYVVGKSILPLEINVMPGFPDDEEIRSVFVDFVLHNATK